MTMRPRQFIPAPPPSGLPTVGPPPTGEDRGLELERERCRQQTWAFGVGLLLGCALLFVWLIEMIGYGFQGVDPPLTVHAVGVGGLLLVIGSCVIGVRTVAQFEALRQRAPPTGSGIGWLRARAGALWDELGYEPDDTAAHDRWAARRLAAVDELVDAASGDAEALMAAARLTHAMTGDEPVAELLADASRAARDRALRSSDRRAR